jgi:hypothetical protein
MRGIDGDGRQQQVELSFTIVLDKSPGIFIELVQAQNPNSFFRKLRTQLFIPALVLLRNELMYLVRNNITLFGQGQPVRPGFAIPVFNLLDQSRQPNLKEFIQIIGADREKLQALQQRIVFILRLFQHAMIELQPGNFAVDVISRVVDRSACHNQYLGECGEMAGRL